MRFQTAALDLEETALFLDYLRTMIRVNLPMDEGLRRLGREASTRRLKEFALHLEQHVAAGSTLVQALRVPPIRVAPLTIALLEAGERSGNLAVMVDFAGRHYRSAVRLSNSFRQALLYPKLVVIFIVVGIIPVSLFAAERMSAIYRDLESPPLLTRWLMGISATFVGHPFVVVAAGLLLGLVMLRPVGPLRRLTSWLQIKAPYLGEMYRATITASMARALGLLVKSGIPLEEAVAKLSLDPDNHLVSRTIDDLAARLKDGSRLSEHLARYPLFPASFAWLVSLGERGENLEEVLLELSDYFEEEARHKGEMAARVVEPASLLLLALVVGPVVLSVFAPMVQMVANIE